METDNKKSRPKKDNSNLIAELSRVSKQNKEKNNSKPKIIKPNVSRSPKLSDVLSSPYKNDSPQRLITPKINSSPKYDNVNTSPKYNNRSPRCNNTPTTLQSPKVPRNTLQLYSPYKTTESDMTKSPLRRSLYNGEVYTDPWLNDMRNVVKDSKIIGVDKFGNSIPVPTANYSLKPLEKYLINERTDYENDYDYIAIGDIYLDQKNSKGKDYNYVSRHMQELSQQTHSLRRQYANKFRDYDLNWKGRVNKKIFDEALEIYENNQVYFQDCIEESTVEYEELCEQLTKMEYWFIAIIEPYSYDEDDEVEYEDWKCREKSKLTEGHSKYLDPELYDYISNPLPSFLVKEIKKYHRGLFKY